MMNLRSFVFMLALFPLSALAHHSRANFDNERETVLVGVIDRLEWKNPHSFAYLKAAGAGGTSVEWAVELGSTPQLSRLGWKPDALVAGDRITVRGNPDKNPSVHMMHASTITKADGSTLTTAQLRASVALLEFTKGKTAHADSIAGIWVSTGSPNAEEAQRVPPFTDKAKAMIAAFDAKDDPFARCIPPPPPFALNTPYLHEIRIEEGRIIFREEHWEVIRTVHMDGRRHPDGPRTNQGHSIGHWEGDVLVVETALFDDNIYGNGAGLSAATSGRPYAPSGVQKRLVERYALTDDRTALRIDFVLEDPEYLAAPVKGTRLWKYAPYLQPVENPCDLENAMSSMGGILN